MRYFDENLARRYVLQRIIALGWTPEVFLDYEGGLREGRQSAHDETRKLERVSKKYQWIALRELEALLSDHFHLYRGWIDSATVFEGAWQLYSPDFDPTRPSDDPAEDHTGRFDNEESDGRRDEPPPPWVNYPDPFRDRRLAGNRSEWVRHIPDDPRQLLQVPNAPGLDTDALVLGLWQGWYEPDSYPPREPGGGVPHLYFHARAWIMPRRHRAKWLGILRKAHFWGEGVELPRLGPSDLGEYPWAERFRSLRRQCEHDDRFGPESPRGLEHAACLCNDTSSVPSPRVVELLQANWSGRDFDFVNGAGTVVSVSPGSTGSRHISPCMVRKDILIAALEKHGLSLIWGVIGERYCFDYNHSRHVADSSVTLSGVYYLDGGGRIKGGLTMRHVQKVDRDDDDGQAPGSEMMELLPFGTELPENQDIPQRGPQVIFG